MTRIYTRSGDDGTTGLIGGNRVSKSSLRLETYGTVDELNAFLGQATAENLQPEIASSLRVIQNQLFEIGAELANDTPSRIDMFPEKAVLQLEHWIDELSLPLPPLTQFILPGGANASAALHVARTVCRRAERHLVALMENEPVNPSLLHYLNRLSDLLFVMARFQNHQDGIADVIWQSTES